MRKRGMAIATVLCAGIVGRSLFAASVYTIEVLETCPYSVVLSWDGYAQVGYNVYRAESRYETPYFLLSVDGTVYTASDATAEPGRVYYYTIEAVDDEHVEISQPVGVEVEDTPDRPVFPSVSLTEDNLVRVTWGYPWEHEGMYIYRSVDGGAVERIAEIASATESEFIDQDVLEGHTYTYSVAAYNHCLISEISTSSFAVTVPYLPDIAVEELIPQLRGEYVKCEFKLVNIGRGRVDDVFDVTVRVNDRVVATMSVSSLYRPGDRVWRSVSFPAPIGSSSRILVTADSRDEIFESAECNNELRETVHVLAGKTLVVGDKPVTAAPAVRIDGRVLKVSGTVENCNVLVTDLQGRQIRSLKLPGSGVLDLTGIAGGIRLIRVTGSSLNWSGKVRL